MTQKQGGGGGKKKLSKLKSERGTDEIVKKEHRENGNVAVTGGRNVGEKQIISQIIRKKSWKTSG